ncbi:MAG TPA: CFI-box-CTERM domain-containing protein [Nitrosopumilaceae archaeon]|nr:CFI-box-CTERM domain-containing protein [Nitrosopumilaceae archaeon]
MIPDKIQQMRRLGYSISLVLSFIIISYGVSGPVFGQLNQTESQQNCGPNEIFRDGQCIAGVDPTPANPNLLLEPKNNPTFIQGNKVMISGKVKLDPILQHAVTIQILNPEGKIVSIDQSLPQSDGSFVFEFIADGPLWKTSGSYEVKARYGPEKASINFNFKGDITTAPPPPKCGPNQELVDGICKNKETTPPPPPPPKCGANQELVNGICIDKEPVVTPPPPPPTCGTGTHLENGKCVPDEERGGCLIATAAFGTELAPQVQMLREIRDNAVLGTVSGTAFMTGFNTFYYSFSPTIADWERENPIFQDAVRITITPMLMSLSLLNHVDIDSEAEMLGYGLSLIILNLGMYFVAPAIVIVKLKKRLQ